MASENQGRKACVFGSVVGADYQGTIYRPPRIEAVGGRSKQTKKMCYDATYKGLVWVGSRLTFDRQPNRLHVWYSIIKSASNQRSYQVSGDNGRMGVSGRGIEADKRF